MLETYEVNYSQLMVFSDVGTSDMNPCFVTAPDHPFPDEGILSIRLLLHPDDAVALVGLQR